MKMGRKRAIEGDKNGVAVVEPSTVGMPENEDYDSDESLHLPVSIFGSDKNEHLRKRKKVQRASRLLDFDDDVSTSKEQLTEQNDARESIAKESIAKSDPGSRFALYLVRKPIELSPEDLDSAHIPLNCPAQESKIRIGSKIFAVRGSVPSTQIYHIPAEIIHSSEKSRFKGIDSPICGVVTITRAEFEGSVEASCDDAGLSRESLLDLPLKVIRKKVSRKGINHLRQRLKANGVKQT